MFRDVSGRVNLCNFRDGACQCRPSPLTHPLKEKHMSKFIENKPDPAAALLRVTLGILFLAHVSLKILVFTPSGTAGYFQSLGLTGFFGYLTILVELLGAVALIVGFQVRLVSLALTPILIGSIVFAHGANGWLFTNAGGGWEFPAFWAVALIVQAILGAGAFAISPDTTQKRSGNYAA